MRAVDHLVGTERVDELLRLVGRRHVAERVGSPAEQRTVGRPCRSPTSSTAHAARRCSCPTTSPWPRRACRRACPARPRSRSRRRPRPPRRRRASAAMRLCRRSSGMSSSPVRTSAPTAAPRPPRLLVSTRQSRRARRAPLRPAPASATERSLITTISPIGSRQATNPARWFGLPNVDQTVLVGPNEALGVDEVDPVPVGAQLDVGDLDEPVQHHGAARREQERREDRAEIRRPPRLGGDERQDRERQTGRGSRRRTGRRRGG